MFSDNLYNIYWKDRFCVIIHYLGAELRRFWGVISALIQIHHVQHDLHIILFILLFCTVSHTLFSTMIPRLNFSEITDFHSNDGHKSKKLNPSNQRKTNNASQSNNSDNSNRSANSSGAKDANLAENLDLQDVFPLLSKSEFDLSAVNLNNNRNVNNSNPAPLLAKLTINKATICENNTFHAQFPRSMCILFAQLLNISDNNCNNLITSVKFQLNTHSHHQLVDLDEEDAFNHYISLTSVENQQNLINLPNFLPIFAHSDAIAIELGQEFNAETDYFLCFYGYCIDYYAHNTSAVNNLAHQFSLLNNLYQLQELINHSNGITNINTEATSKNDEIGDNSNNNNNNNRYFIVEADAISPTIFYNYNLLTAELYAILACNAQILRNFNQALEFLSKSKDLLQEIKNTLESAIKQSNFALKYYYFYELSHINHSKMLISLIEFNFLAENSKILSHNYGNIAVDCQFSLCLALYNACNSFSQCKTSISSAESAWNSLKAAELTQKASNTDSMSKILVEQDSLADFFADSDDDFEPKDGKKEKAVTETHSFAMLPSLFHLHSDIKSNLTLLLPLFPSLFNHLLQFAQFSTHTALNSLVSPLFSCATLRFSLVNCINFLFSELGNGCGPLIPHSFAIINAELINSARFVGESPLVLHYIHAIFSVYTNFNAIYCEFSPNLYFPLLNQIVQALHKLENSVNSGQSSKFSDSFFVCPLFSQNSNLQSTARLNLLQLLLQTVQRLQGDCLTVPIHFQPPSNYANNPVLSAKKRNIIKEKQGFSTSTAENHSDNDQNQQNHDNSDNSASFLPSLTFPCLLASLADENPLVSTLSRSVWLCLRDYLGVSLLTRGNSSYRHSNNAKGHLTHVNLNIPLHSLLIFASQVITNCTQNSSASFKNNEEIDISDNISEKQAELTELRCGLAIDLIRVLSKSQLELLHYAFTTAFTQFHSSHASATASVALNEFYRRIVDSYLRESLFPPVLNTKENSSNSLQAMNSLNSSSGSAAQFTGATVLSSSYAIIRLAISDSYALTCNALVNRLQQLLHGQNVGNFNALKQLVAAIDVCTQLTLGFIPALGFPTVSNSNSLTNSSNVSPSKPPRSIVGSGNNSGCNTARLALNINPHLSASAPHIAPSTTNSLLSLPILAVSRVFHVSYQRQQASPDIQLHIQRVTSLSLQNSHNQSPSLQAAITPRLLLTPKLMGYEKRQSSGEHAVNNSSNNSNLGGSINVTNSSPSMNFLPLYSTCPQNTYYSHYTLFHTYLQPILEVSLDSLRSKAPSKDLLNFLLVALPYSFPCFLCEATFTSVYLNYLGQLLPWIPGCTADENFELLDLIISQLFSCKLSSHACVDQINSEKTKNNSVGFPLSPELFNAIIHVLLDKFTVKSAAYRQFRDHFINLIIQFDSQTAVVLAGQAANSSLNKAAASSNNPPSLSLAGSNLNNFYDYEKRCYTDLLTESCVLAIHHSQTADRLANSYANQQSEEANHGNFTEPHALHDVNLNNLAAEKRAAELNNDRLNLFLQFLTFVLQFDAQHDVSLSLYLFLYFQRSFRSLNTVLLRLLSSPNQKFRLDSVLCMAVIRAVIDKFCLQQQSSIIRLLQQIQQEKAAKNSAKEAESSEDKAQSEPNSAVLSDVEEDEDNWEQFDEEDGEEAASGSEMDDLGGLEEALDAVDSDEEEISVVQSNLAPPSGGDDVRASVSSVFALNPLSPSLSASNSHWRALSKHVRRPTRTLNADEVLAVAATKLFEPEKIEAAHREIEEEESKLAQEMMYSDEEDEFEGLDEIPDEEQDQINEIKPLGSSQAANSGADREVSVRGSRVSRRHNRSPSFGGSVNSRSYSLHGRHFSNGSHLSANPTPGTEADVVTTLSRASLEETIDLTFNLIETCFFRFFRCALVTAVATADDKLTNLVLKHAQLLFIQTRNKLNATKHSLIGAENGEEGNFNPPAWIFWMSEVYFSVSICCRSSSVLVRSLASFVLIQWAAWIGEICATEYNINKNTDFNENNGEDNEEPARAAPGHNKTPSIMITSADGKASQPSNSLKIAQIGGHSKNRSVSFAADDESAEILAITEATGQEKPVSTRPRSNTLPPTSLNLPTHHSRQHKSTSLVKNLDSFKGIQQEIDEFVKESKGSSENHNNSSILNSSSTVGSPTKLDGGSSSSPTAVLPRRLVKQYSRQRCLHISRRKARGNSNLLSNNYHALLQYDSHYQSLQQLSFGLLTAAQNLLNSNELEERITGMQIVAAFLQIKQQHNGSYPANNSQSSQYINAIDSLALDSLLFQLNDSLIRSNSHESNGLFESSYSLSSVTDFSDFGNSLHLFRSAAAGGTAAPHSAYLKGSSEIAVAVYIPIPALVLIELPRPVHSSRSSVPVNHRASFHNRLPSVHVHNTAVDSSSDDDSDVDRDSDKQQAKLNSSPFTQLLSASNNQSGGATDESTRNKIWNSILARLARIAKEEWKVDCRCAASALHALIIKANKYKYSSSYVKNTGDNEFIVHINVDRPNFNQAIVELLTLQRFPQTAPAVLSVGPQPLTVTAAAPGNNPNQLRPLSPAVAINKPAASLVNLDDYSEELSSFVLRILRHYSSMVVKFPSDKSSSLLSDFHSNPSNNWVHNLFAHTRALQFYWNLSKLHWAEADFALKFEIWRGNKEENEEIALDQQGIFILDSYQRALAQQKLAESSAASNFQLVPSAGKENLADLYLQTNEEDDLDIRSYSDSGSDEEEVFNSPQQNQNKAKSQPREENSPDFAGSVAENLPVEDDFDVELVEEDSEQPDFSADEAHFNVEIQENRDEVQFDDKFELEEAIPQQQVVINSGRNNFSVRARPQSASRYGRHRNNPQNLDENPANRASSPAPHPANAEPEGNQVSEAVEQALAEISVESPAQDEVDESKSVSSAGLDDEIISSTSSSTTDSDQLLEEMQLDAHSSRNQQENQLPSHSDDSDLNSDDQNSADEELLSPREQPQPQQQEINMVYPRKQLSPIEISESPVLAAAAAAEAEEILEEFEQIEEIVAPAVNELAAAVLNMSSQSVTEITMPGDEELAEEPAEALNSSLSELRQEFHAFLQQRMNNLASGQPNNSNFSLKSDKFTPLQLNTLSKPQSPTPAHNLSPTRPNSYKVGSEDNSVMASHTEINSSAPISNANGFNIKRKSAARVRPASSSAIINSGSKPPLFKALSLSNSGISVSKPIATMKPKKASKKAKTVSQEAIIAQAVAAAARRNSSGIKSQAVNNTVPKKAGSRKRPQSAKPIKKLISRSSSSSSSNGITVSQPLLHNNFLKSSHASINHSRSQSSTVQSNSIISPRRNSTFSQFRAELLQALSPQTSTRLLYKTQRENSIENYRNQHNSASNRPQTAPYNRQQNQ
jgi:hypothetical protein